MVSPGLGFGTSPTRGGSQKQSKLPVSATREARVGPGNGKRDIEAPCGWPSPVGNPQCHGVQVGPQSGPGGRGSYGQCPPPPSCWPGSAGPWEQTDLAVQVLPPPPSQMCGFALGSGPSRAQRRPRLFTRTQHRIQWDGALSGLASWRGWRLKQALKNKDLEGCRRVRSQA